MIEARGLAFSYRGSGAPVFSGADFRVAAGEVVGIIGAAGAGKTTLHKILSGALRSYSGAAFFEGKDLQDWSRDFFEAIGVTFQLPGVFPALTARGNLAYFARLYRSSGGAPEELLEKLGLRGQASIRASKLPPESLKLLDLARALVHRPRALLLDEPLEDLDSAAASAVKAMLRERRDAGAAVAIFTRDREAASGLCDRMLLLTEGRLAPQGAP